MLEVKHFSINPQVLSLTNTLNKSSGRHDPLGTQSTSTRPINSRRSWTAIKPHSEEPGAGARGFFYGKSQLLSGADRQTRVAIHPLPLGWARSGERARESGAFWLFHVTPRSPQERLSVCRRRRPPQQMPLRKVIRRSRLTIPSLKTSGG